MQTSLNTSLANTGTRNDGTTDKVCNIYDMASNTAEFTTETFMDIDDPCVVRGAYFRSFSYASWRECIPTSVMGGDGCGSFRPLLYIK